jgi:hypothetical protein
MKRKQKMLVNEYTCLDCGWTTTRVMRLVPPTKCSRCDSSNTQGVEKELEVEIETYETHTPEDYRKAHRITMDLINGVPLEEIKELGLEESLARTSEERAKRGQWGRMFSCSSSPWISWGHGPSDTVREIVKKCGVTLVKYYYDGEPQYF